MSALDQIDPASKGFHKVVFPVDLEAEHATGRANFLVQDPILRSKILPLFAFDPEHPEERPVGHGTAFRIDPWSRCATAFHNLEPLLKPNQALDGFDLRADIRLVALEVNGIAAYGTMPIPKDAWRTLSGAYLPGGVHTPPLFHEAPRVKNMTELCALRIRPSKMPSNGTPYLPVALRGWQPKIGEEVLALGFPELDVDKNDEGADRPIRQYLHGSIGRIIEFQKADPASSRPWPVIRVDAECLGGMSGGPVINSAGNVVGLVSTGIKGDPTGTATVFSGWGVAPHVYGALDPNNPGWFHCYGAFDEDGELRITGQDFTEIQDLAAKSGFKEIAPITYNHRAQEHVRL